MDRGPGAMSRSRAQEVRMGAASANLSVTSDRLKGHRGAGTSTGPLQQDAGHSGASGAGDDSLSEAQLVRKAQAIHNDTTATAERALRLVEESKQIKDATLKELDVQNRKLENLNDNLHDMNETLTYSEKLLRYMRRCCCCWMFDSCTGADPEAKAEREWQEYTARTEYKDNDSYNGMSPRTRKRHADKKKTPPPANFRDPDTNLGKGHESQANQLAKETHTQNRMLDQIEKGLDELLEGAKDIGDAVDEQDKRISKLQSKAEKTKDRVGEMNGKSQLRKYQKDKF